MAESYTLHYFDFNGRAEPIRMLLKYGSIPFIDNRISMEDWPEIKPSMPYKQLPILEIDGELIPQSLAICRYLANKVQLDGYDEKENFRIDVTVDIINELLLKLLDHAFEQDGSTESTSEQKLLNEIIPLYLARFEERAKANGGYIALTRLSWAEIIFICFYEDAVNFMKKNTIADYPNLIQVMKNVLAVPAIKEWIETRPKCQMNSFYDLKSEL